MGCGNFTSSWQPFSQAINSDTAHCFCSLSTRAPEQAPAQFLEMTSRSPHGRQDLTESGVTITSDSENYEANNELSSPASSSSSPLILYKPPTVWGLVRGAAINFILPFINGLMMGFGELFAHEVAFRFGWSKTKVYNRDVH